MRKKYPVVLAEAERIELERLIAAWQGRRNATARPVTWRFTTDDARIKLRRLYPSV